MEQPPNIEMIEVRYPKVDSEKFNRIGTTIEACLEHELNLKDAKNWANILINTIIQAYVLSPFFWDHVNIYSQEIWNMAQTVRRVLKKDAYTFFGGNRKLLEKTIRARGAKFNARFSYFYKSWIYKYHGYIQEPSNMISQQVVVPNEDSMWLIIIQFYPSIFYEELDTGILWRKGGIKIEKLTLIEDLWYRTEENMLASRIVELAWYTSPNNDSVGIIDDITMNDLIEQSFEQSNEQSTITVN
jgi:hypothetical protein